MKVAAGMDEGRRGKYKRGGKEAKSRTEVFGAESQMKGRRK